MGPLKSLSVVEFAGLGPAPLAGQLLADMGADVVVIDRKPAPVDVTDVNARGKRSIVLDLKSPAGLAAAHKVIARSDVLIEGFRPGVMERLGLGPADCPNTLIYARMTGWGQDGPWAHMAGHDINYLALTGALNAMGAKDAPPIPPMNLVADYGGGTMFLLFGILSALFERGVSGRGQVVDAAMVDGVPAMMGLIHGFLANGRWNEDRFSNLFDGAAPFYRCYTCADGRFISVGALEPQFYALLLDGLGLPSSYAETQNDRSTWAARSAEFADVFKTRSRDEWAAHFDGSDACVAPVMSFTEAAEHPHMAARRALQSPEGVLQSAPAPRFSRSVPADLQPIGAKGADTAEVLRDAGLTEAEIAELMP